LLSHPAALAEKARDDHDRRQAWVGVAYRRPVSALSRRSISVQSLLHGSPEAKKEEILQHSRLVGRGKYVHGFEVHRVVPNKAEEYKKAACVLRLR